MPSGIDPEIQRLAQRLAPVLPPLLQPPAFIGARYSTNAGHSFTSGTPAVVNYEDADYDPLSLVTTGAGWAFACPVAGYYQVNASILFAASAAWAPGDGLGLYVHRDGANVAARYQDDLPAATVYAGATVSDIIACAAGQTLRVVAAQSTGGSLALFADAIYNYVSITRLG